MAEERLTEEDLLYAEELALGDEFTAPLVAEIRAAWAEREQAREQANMARAEVNGLRLLLGKRPAKTTYWYNSQASELTFQVRQEPNGHAVMVWPDGGWVQCPPRLAAVLNHLLGQAKALTDRRAIDSDVTEVCYVNYGHAEVAERDLATVRAELAEVRRSVRATLLSGEVGADENGNLCLSENGINNIWAAVAEQGKEA